MHNKLFNKIKKFIKENIIFILFLILFTIVLNIKVPYVVTSPGKLLNINNKITEDGKSIKSNYYLTYVSVREGRVASLLMSFVIPNWDLEKVSKFVGSDDISYEDSNKIGSYLLKQSENEALEIAYKEANIPYEVKYNKLIVLDKIKDFDIDIKLGDEVLKCNNKSVILYDELKSCIDESGDEVNLTIKRDNKTFEKSYKLNFLDGEKVIGISLYNDYDIISDRNIKIDSDGSESGSSGGLMLSLALYDHLTNAKRNKNLIIAGTGTIDSDGNVGEIGGVKYKLLGADKNKASIFLCPKDNYDEAKKIKKKYKLKLKIVKVKTFDDALNYINSLNN